MESEDSEGWTPLHRAVWKNRVGCVQLLLSHGANKEARRSHRFFGWTPLHIAAYCDCSEVARLLLQSEVNTMALTEDNKTPRDIAIERQSKVLVLFKADLEKNSKIPLEASPHKRQKRTLTLLSTDLNDNTQLF